MEKNRGETEGIKEKITMSKTTNYLLDIIWQSHAMWFTYMILFNPQNSLEKFPF